MPFELNETVNINLKKILLPRYPATVQKQTKINENKNRKRNQ